MKKTVLNLLLTAILMFLPLSGNAAFDISVEMTGPESLTALKPGLEKTIFARCIASGIDSSSAQSLNVSITQMGDVISFDAFLNSKPPKAFHKDLKDAGGLSAAIDEMIQKILVAAPTLQAMEEKKKDDVPIVEPSVSIVQPSAQCVLPIEATSITSMDGAIFVSDKNTIYTVSDNTTQTWWNAPEGDLIFRIYPYNGHIISIVNHKGSFHTYKINNGTTIDHWKKPVVPAGDGLISAKFTLSPNLLDRGNRWGKIKTIEGNPDTLPKNTDIISVAVADIDLKTEGLETISINKTDKLMLKNNDKVLWIGESTMTGPPLSLQKEGVIQVVKPTDNFSKIDLGSHKYKLQYNLPPKILVLDDNSIITFSNASDSEAEDISESEEEPCPEILSYTWHKKGLREKVIHKISEGYCADLTVKDNKLMALIVKEGQSTLLTIELK